VPLTGETTLFVYDASGKMVAEYSTIVTPPSEAKVSYLTNDHPGSPRVITDQNGQVVSRRDFHPFGEEIYTAQRTQGLNYAGDTVRQKFTSYERDIESNLDFAQARYYSNQHGRFTSVDPLMASARASNPKTWNRYTYALNNPLKYIDPDGMDVQVLDEKAQDYLLKTLPKEIRDKVKAQIDKDGKLKKGSLDKIKSKDQNFLDLKTMVNDKSITEVMTATEAIGNGINTGKFHQRTAEENKEYDIQNYMKNFNVSREEAEAFFKEQGTTWTETAVYGYTLNPSESPSGNLRVVITDRTGEGATISEEEAVVTTGHELYGHALRYMQGKPYLHKQVPESVFEVIEERTRKNYQNGEKKVNTPKNIKPNN
jgi:RHS repeat-associated protein